MFADVSLTEFIKSAGYLGIFLMVFAESGLFFGFIFPGDSLLFVSGLLASQGIFDLRLLLIIFISGAIIGDSVGYWTGKKSGDWLKKKKDSRFFKRAYFEKAHKFYSKHGGKALVISRFTPTIRSFVPIAAGMADMEYHAFLRYNILGGISWGGGVTLLGYYLGNSLPDFESQFGPILGAVIALCVLTFIFMILILPYLIHRGTIKIKP